MRRSICACKLNFFVDFTKRKDILLGTVTFFIYLVSYRLVLFLHRSNPYYNVFNSIQMYVINYISSIYKIDDKIKKIEDKLNPS